MAQPERLDQGPHRGDGPHGRRVGASETTLPRDCWQIGHNRKRSFFAASCRGDLIM